MSEEIWETFDELFRKANRNVHRIEELEARVVELEKRLSETSSQSKTNRTLTVLNEMPAEKAA